MKAIAWLWVTPGASDAHRWALGAVFSSLSSVAPARFE